MAQTPFCIVNEQVHFATLQNHTDFLRINFA